MSNLNFSHATLTNRKLLTFQEREREKKAFACKINSGCADLRGTRTDHCNDSVMAYLH